MMKVAEENLCILWMSKNFLSYNIQHMIHKRKHVELEIEHLDFLNFSPKSIKRKDYRKVLVKLLFDSELVYRYGKQNSKMALRVFKCWEITIYSPFSLNADRAFWHLQNSNFLNWILFHGKYGCSHSVLRIRLRLVRDSSFFERENSNIVRGTSV